MMVDEDLRRLRVDLECAQSLRQIQDKIESEAAATTCTSAIHDSGGVNWTQMS
jgi:hypothetical protein